MPEFKSPGQLAYEGFYQKSGGKSVITSEPLPAWGAHTQALKDSWEAAAAAINIPQNVPNPAERKPEPKPEPPKPQQPQPSNVFAKLGGVKSEPEPPKAVTQTIPAKEPQKFPVQPPLKPKTF